jgi:F420-dependent oxidoreductase-like protein
MVAISLMIEGQNGLTWPRWQRIASEAEHLGFAGLFRSDHFTNAGGPMLDSLEMVVSLAYLAVSSTRLHFGPLVAPLSFRQPVQLARQAAALDDLSGGRMLLGLGAGWQDREHTTFGFELGDTRTRMDRFEEGLEVITLLLHSDEPVTYDGRYFQLRDALLLPRPTRPGGPPIAIGGTGLRRTLPLTARYADVWNALMVSPSEFHGLSAALDEHLRVRGRPPRAVRRTLMTNVVFARDDDALAAKLPGRGGASLEDAVAAMRAVRRNIVGTPAMVRAQIAEYADAGVEELMLQWQDFDDIDGLRAFAEAVVPDTREARDA